MLLILRCKRKKDIGDEVVGKERMVKEMRKWMDIGGGGRSAPAAAGVKKVVGIPSLHNQVKHTTTHTQSNPKRIRTNQTPTQYIIN